MPNHPLEFNLSNGSTLDATPNARLHGSSSPLKTDLDHTAKSSSTSRPSATAQTTPGKLVSGISATPSQDLIYNGGKTIANLQYANLYVGGSQSWNSSDIQSIDTSLNAVMTDSTLNNILSQYFNNKPITSTFLGSTFLSGSAPSAVSQNSLESYISWLDQAGDLNGFNLGSTVFNFMLPSGTVLSGEGADSLNGLGGYHGSVHVNASGKSDTVYYAVGAYSQTFANGTSNGVSMFNQPWKNVVATFYHELSEARTDPDVEDVNRTGNSRYAGWLSAKGNECGDFPVAEGGKAVFLEVPLANGKGTVPIQLQYSNRVHGPENPYAGQVASRSLTTIAALSNPTQTTQALDLSELAPRTASKTRMDTAQTEPQKVHQKREFFKDESLQT